MPRHRPPGFRCCAVSGADRNPESGSDPALHIPQAGKAPGPCPPRPHACLPPRPAPHARPRLGLHPRPPHPPRSGRRAACSLLQSRAPWAIGVKTRLDSGAAPGSPCARRVPPPRAWPPPRVPDLGPARTARANCPLRARPTPARARPPTRWLGAPRPAQAWAMRPRCAKSQARRGCGLRSLQSLPSRPAALPGFRAQPREGPWSPAPLAFKKVRGCATAPRPRRFTCRYLLVA